MLRFALFDDAQTGCGIVRLKQAIERQGNFHRTGNPDHFTDGQSELFGLVGGKGQHPFHLITVE